MNVSLRLQADASGKHFRASGDGITCRWIDGSLSRHLFPSAWTQRFLIIDFMNNIK